MSAYERTVLTVMIFIIGVTLSRQTYLQAGSCPKVTTQSNFEIDRYVGLWYEIVRYETIFELGAECVTAKYDPLPDGTISVNNSYLSPRNKYQSINGVARQNRPGVNDGKLIVSFHGVPVDGKYWVLETDYSQYSVVWSCTQYSPLWSVHYCWVLSRTPVISPVAQDKAQQALARNKINIAKFRTTKQDDALCKRI